MTYTFFSEAVVIIMMEEDRDLLIKVKNSIPEHIKVLFDRTTDIGMEIQVSKGVTACLKQRHKTFLTQSISHKTDVALDYLWFNVSSNLVLAGASKYIEDLKKKTL